MTRRLSASGLDTARKCPASFALPAVDFGERPEATAGTLRHQFLDDFAREWSVDRDVARAREAVLSAAQATHGDAPWLASMLGMDLGAQVESRGEVAARIDVGGAFALNLPTLHVEPLQPLEHRAYRELSDDWLCGTYDWCLTFPSGRVLLVDFKGPKRVTSARENLQLAFYGYCLAHDLGVDRIDVELRHIDDEGGVFVDSASLDEWDLDAVPSRLRKIVHRVTSAREALREGRVPEMSIGDYCHYCPSQRVCPSQIAALRELFDESEKTELGLVGLSPELAGKAWIRVEAVVSLAEKIKATLRERVISEGSLPLPDGKLVPLKVSRTSVDATKALPVIAELVGDERAQSMIDQSMESSAIDRIAAELARERGEKIKAVKAQIWGRLEARGAVSRKPFVQIRRVE